MKNLQRIKSAVVVLAVILSLWAGYVSLLLFGWTGRMLFVDSNLPRRSFDAFLHEIPSQVRDDVFTAHESGVRMIAVPLILSALLWFGAYLITELQRNRSKPSEQDGCEE